MINACLLHVLLNFLRYIDNTATVVASAVTSSIIIIMIAAAIILWICLKVRGF